MALNEFIKDDARKEFAKNYRNNKGLVKVKGKDKKVEFVMVAGGSFGRKLLRRIAKSEIQKNKGQLMSPLGKMRSRQERKAMAKALKMDFIPRYNGEVKDVKQHLEEYTTPKGVKYQRLVKVVK